MSNEHDGHRHDELDAIDRLIGDVARSMTTAPSSADLARRVSTRIAGEDARRGHRSWARSWVLAPAAAACVLLLAVFVARETRESPPPVRGAIARPAPSAPDSVTREPAPRDVGEPRAPGARGRAGVEQPARRSPSAAASIPDAAIPPLALPPIAAIERIEVSPIARGDQIDITGIAIERLEIAPMP
jgi:hypothetical protein